MQKRRALVTKEEKRLVLKSDIIKKYLELESILTKDDKVIYDKDIQYLKTTNKKLYDVIIHGFKEIKDTASEEWYQAGYKGNYITNCELCGHPSLTHVYKIVDKINGNLLLVGSDCIYKFKNMDKKISGIDIKQHLRLLATNNTKKVEKIINFNNKYPQGEEIIKSWRNVYNEFDLVIPKELDDNFLKLFRDSTKFYKDYTNGKIEEKELERFKFFIIDYNYRIKKYLEFRKDNISKLLSCNKNIKQWLMDNEKNNIIERITLSNGSITKDIVKYIYCVEFINRFKDIIKLQFSNHNISLMAINSNNITFNYKYKTYNYINLQLTLKEFAEKYLVLFCSRKPQLEKDYIVNNIKIENTYFDINEYINICISILKKSDFTFKFDDDLYRRQDIEIINKSQKKYAVINIIEFINQNVAILFKDELESKGILMNSISKIRKWDDVVNKEKYKVTESDMSSRY